MKSIDLLGTIRQETGKSSNAKLRNKKRVPCILYGGKEIVKFSVLEADLKPIIYTPHVYIVNLNIDGKTILSKIQDLQFHPVSDAVVHVDFYEVTEDKRIDIELPVKVVGNSLGVKEGGKLVQDLRKLKVRGIVKNLPEEIVIDITDLGLGKSLRVAELSATNMEFLDMKTAPVVSVKLTRAARGAAEAAAPAAAAK